MGKVSEKPEIQGRETMASLSGRQWWRQDSVTLVRLLIAAVLIAAGLWYLTWRAAPPIVLGQASCDAGSSPFAPNAAPAASSAHTIKQAYNCILDRYPTALDSRSLLQHAMIGMVNYLVQQHQDLRSAALPALTGDRQKDWQAFEQTYTTMTAHRSLNQRELVAAAIAEMVNSLHDNHAYYRPAQPDPGAQPSTRIGLGIHLLFDPDQFMYALPPLYILQVDPGSPAEQAGVRPGDTIVTINGISPFIGQQPVQQVVLQISDSTPVQLQVRHPGSDKTISVNLTPAAYPDAPLVSTRMLAGNILYVHFTEFKRGVYEQINRAVQGAGAQLKGVILDLRGNGGGDVEEQRRVISLFVHNKIIASFVDKQGQRTDQRTDERVPLLHVRLVALIDRGCGSACDATAMDIRDLHLGRLVGERTAGVVSGPSSGFFLDDGSVVIVPVSFMQGPAGEIVDGIGVPPDDEVQSTQADLAAGRDPVLEKALQGL
ncbi:hypothetical protein KSD_03380 [Ktedonobacter sp. SOSP1-85]|uniref:S41 family peptidase n=1 Tax=Ktedonobacter sp. SOSP1-85 TaxID=2778367 RepID=UPI0019166D4D|nr:S41 family peptidase [Ktedonobacter sp. SOSP1-85]GHO72567.1 hypothetical protein KSD_03380 [Ktedonobacter sp. SOSP1-85]